MGRAQLEVPSWFIMMWCEQGANVAWVKKDISLKLKRDIKHLKWWFSQEHGGVGIGCAATRGMRLEICAKSPHIRVERTSKFIGGGSASGGGGGGEVVTETVHKYLDDLLSEPHDYEVVECVSSARLRDIEELKSNIYPETSFSSIVLFSP